MTTLASIVLIAACDSPLDAGGDGPRGQFRVSLSPSAATLVSLQDTVRLTATDPSGVPVPGDSLTWRSSDAAVALVDREGLVTSVSNGSAVITASIGSQASDPATILVEQVADSVGVSPTAVTLLDVAATAVVSAQAWDANGFEITDADASWVSLNPDVAEVASAGEVRAVRHGQTAVEATVDDAIGYGFVNVRQPGPGPDRTWALAAPLGAPVQSIWRGPDEVWTTGKLATFLDESSVTQFNGTNWTLRTPDSHERMGLFDVWGSGPGDVWVVGWGVTGGTAYGLVQHFDGTAWSDVTPGIMLQATGFSAGALWGTVEGELFVGGPNGMFRYDGAVWHHDIQMGEGANIKEIWGTSGDDVWAAGGGWGSTYFRWDGASWQSDTIPTRQDLRGISGTASDDVWVITDTEVWHWDGVEWQLSAQFSGLTGVLATGRDEAWVAGDEVASGSVWRFDGSGWSELPGPTLQDNEALSSIAGTGPDDLWVGSSIGRVYRFDGTVWSDAGRRSVRVDFTDAWSSSPDDMWAVADGSVVGFDRDSWSEAIRGPDLSPDQRLGDIERIWGLGPEHAWAVGRSTYLQWDGRAWERGGTVIPSATTPSVWASSPHDLWLFDQGVRRFDGSQWTVVGGGGDFMTDGYGFGPDDVWIVGRGEILHFDGVELSPVPVPVEGADLRAIWGSAPDDIWAVGEGIILHYDGESWSPSPTPVPSPRLWNVWGTGPSDVYAVGGTNNGGLLFHFDGTAWRDITPAEARTRLRAVVGSRDGPLWVLGDYGRILVGR